MYWTCRVTFAVPVWPGKSTSNSKSSTSMICRDRQIGRIDEIDARVARVGLRALDQLFEIAVGSNDSFMASSPFQRRFRRADANNSVERYRSPVSQ